MFGYIAANLHDLDEAEQQRYRAAYCGLCHALKERFGQASRFSLTYDMAFLTLLLGSLYEPQEQTGRERCVAHPMKPHDYLTTRFTDYAADLSVALAYHKCLDDWNDDRSVRARAYAGMLERAYGDVKQRLPRQCAAIEDGLADITRIERTPDAPPDAAANRFGALLGELFVCDEDIWSDTLRQFDCFKEAERYLLRIAASSYLSGLMAGMAVGGKNCDAEKSSDAPARREKNGQRSA